MAAYDQSQDYGTLQVRDVMEIFKTIIKQSPTLLSLIPVSAEKATNHKHEWLEYSKAPKAWEVDGASAIAATALTLVSTTGIKVGDVLKFKKTTGGSVSVKAKVTVVVSATVLTITRIGTDVEIPDEAEVYLVSRAVAENSGESKDDNAAPSQKFNYTQIFRRDLGLSRTSLQTALYGLATEAKRDNKTQSLVDFQVLNQLREIAWELNQSLMEGVLEKRVKGGANGAMGGILPYVESDASSVLDASAAALSATIINNALAQAKSNGANGMNMTVMLCHTRQARVMSTFNTSKIQIMRGDIEAGNYIARFQSDLAGTNGGSNSIIVVDDNFPEDKVLIMNPENNAIVPMENITVTETTEAKTDGRTWKVLGELTAEFRNANEENILIENLAL